MTRIDRFVAAFNQLHHTMTQLLKSTPKDIPFATAVIQLYDQRNPIVVQHKNDIEVIRQLRNFLIHEDTDLQHDIAEPSEHIIALTQHIEQQLAVPKTMTLFEREVLSFRTDDYLTVVLKAIRQHGYSQFPIFDEQGFVGILSDNRITRWLATHQGRTISLQDIVVADILRIVQEETDASYRFVSKNDTLFTIHATFVAEHPAVLLLTNSGQPPQRASDIRGIVTAWDFPNITAAIFQHH